MKLTNLLKLSLILFAFALPISADAQQEVSLRKGATAQKWIDNLFTKGKLPPFSFTYGEESSEKFIRKWNFSKKRVASDDANVIKYEITYSEPGSKGIEVKCDVTGFSAFEAVVIIRSRILPLRNLLCRIFIQRLQNRFYNMIDHLSSNTHQEIEKKVLVPEVFP